MSGVRERISVLDRLSQGEGVAPEERESLDLRTTQQLGEFEKGLRRFGYSAAATTEAFVGQVAEPFAPEFAERRRTSALETIESQPDELRPNVGSFEEARATGNYRDYVASVLGEGLPSVATVLAGRGAGGLAARGLRAPRVAGQVVGGVGAAVPLEGGETALNLASPEARANTTAAERAAYSVGRGVVNAALENVVPQAVFARQIAGAARATPGFRGGIEALGRTTAAGTLGEAATEGVQDLTGQAVQNLAVPGTGFDAGSAIESAVRGGITGGVLGGAGSSVNVARSNLAQRAETTESTEEAQTEQPRERMPLGAKQFRDLGGQILRGAQEELQSIRGASRQNVEIRQYSDEEVDVLAEQFAEANEQLGTYFDGAKQAERREAVRALLIGLDNPSYIAAQAGRNRALDTALNRFARRTKIPFTDALNSLQGLNPEPVQDSVPPGGPSDIGEAPIAFDETEEATIAAAREAQVDDDAPGVETVYDDEGNPVNVIDGKQYTVPYDLKAIQGSLQDKKFDRPEDQQTQFIPSFDVEFSSPDLTPAQIGVLFGTKEDGNQREATDSELAEGVQATGTYRTRLNFQSLGAIISSEGTREQFEPFVGRASSDPNVQDRRQLEAIAQLANGVEIDPAELPAEFGIDPSGPPIRINAEFDLQRLTDNADRVLLRQRDGQKRFLADVQPTRTGSDNVDSSAVGDLSDRENLNRLNNEELEAVTLNAAAQVLENDAGTTNAELAQQELDRRTGELAGESGVENIVPENTVDDEFEARLRDAPSREQELRAGQRPLSRLAQRRRDQLLVDEKRREVQLKQEAMGRRIRAITGDAVDVEIGADLPDGVNAEYTPADAETGRATIKVAAGMEEKNGLAEHEAFHAVFRQVFENNPEARRILGTAFTTGQAGRRLREIFKDDPAVLAKIDPAERETYNAEEAAAYAFQVYATDPSLLKLNREQKTIFQRFGDMYRDVSGNLSAEDRAYMLFEELNEGLVRADEQPLALQAQGARAWAQNNKVGRMAEALGTATGALWDKTLTSTYQRILDFENPALAQVARLGYQRTGDEGDPGYIQNMRMNSNVFLNKLGEVYRGMTPEDIRAVHDAMIAGETLGKGTKLGRAQQGIKDLLREALDYQVDAGLEVGDRGPDYYPLQWAPEKVIAQKGEFLAMMAKYEDQLAEMNLTPQDVYESISSYELNNKQFADMLANDEPILEHARSRALAFIDPADRRQFMDDDGGAAMVHYLQQAVRSTEYAKSFGIKGEKLESLLTEARDVYGATEQETNFVRNEFVGGLMGNKEVGMNRDLKDAYGALVVYQNLRLLPFAAFSSLVDPIGIAIRTNDMGAAWEGFTYSMRNLFRDWQGQYTPDQWEQIATDLGVVEASGTPISTDARYTGVTLSGKLRAVNDAFFRANLLNGMVRNHHVVATKRAALFLQRSADGLFGEQRSAENLQEVGVAPENIVTLDDGRMAISMGDFREAGFDNDAALDASNEIKTAINKIVRQSLIVPSSAEMPAWMSNPYLAPIAHLKSFIWGFNNTILRRLAHEANRGNYAPVLYSAAYVPGMIAADFMRDMVSGFGEEPEYKKNWGVSDYLKQGVYRSGLLGTGQLFLDAKTDMTRGGTGLEAFAGPTLEQAKDVGFALGSGSGDRVWTQVVNALPANAVYDQWID